MSDKIIAQAEEYIKLFDLQKEQEKALSALKEQQGTRLNQMLAIEKTLASHVGNIVPQCIVPIDHRAVVVVFTPATDACRSHTTVNVVEMVRKS